MPVFFISKENDLVLSNSIVYKKRKQKDGMIMQRIESDENVVISYVAKIPFQLLLFLLSKILLFRKIIFLGQLSVPLQLLH